MQISMIGIDHSKAPIKYREKFSFTRQNAQKAAVLLKEGYNLSGCIFISTCNRTELWIAGNEDYSMQFKPGNMLAEMLCSMRGVKKQDYMPYFTIRHNEEAIRHIFRLSCGLDSKIFGEDQIISQVRDSLYLAREAKTTGLELDRLFQTAIAVGKKVKTEVRLKNANQSSADSIVKILKEEGLVFSDLKCLVIGNGKMGKLVVNALMNAGADVSMTLRRKIHNEDEKESITPAGCKMIPYDDRIENLAKNQIVVSATLSPHYTITKNQFLENKSEDIEFFKKNKDGEKIRYMFDLAVPRDIQESIGEEDGVCLNDIDSLESPNEGGENFKVLEKAGKIIDKCVVEFVKWLKFRDNLPRISIILENMKADVEDRMKSCKARTKLTDEEFEEIVNLGNNAIKSMIFETAKALSDECFESGLSAMEKAGFKESLRH